MKVCQGKFITENRKIDARDILVLNIHLIIYIITFNDIEEIYGFGMRNV